MKERTYKFSVPVQSCALKDALNQNNLVEKTFCYNIYIVDASIV